MSKALGRTWSQRAGRRAIRALLAIGKDGQVDAQVRVNALALVTECCGEDITEEPVQVRAVGFVAGGEP